MAPLVPCINSWHSVFYECGFSSCFYYACRAFLMHLLSPLACLKGTLSINDTSFQGRTKDPVFPCKEVSGWDVPAGDPWGWPCTLPSPALPLCTLAAGLNTHLGAPISTPISSRLCSWVQGSLQSQLQLSLQRNKRWEMTRGRLSPLRGSDYQIYMLHR